MNWKFCAIAGFKPESDCAKADETDRSHVMPAATANLFIGSSYCLHWFGGI
jgi:hypothetical protein